MSNKTKNTKTTTDKITNAAQQAGLVIMTAAFTLGIVEMPESSHGNKAVLPSQPSFAFAHDQGGGSSESNMRRAEEAGPHHTSYNTAQRTPSRAGKV